MPTFQRSIPVFYGARPRAELPCCTRTQGCICAQWPTIRGAKVKPYSGAFNDVPSAKTMVETSKRVFILVKSVFHSFMC